MDLKLGQNIRAVKRHQIPKDVKENLFDKDFDLRPRIKKIYEHHRDGYFEQMITNIKLPHGPEIIEHINKVHPLYWGYAGHGSWEISPIMYGAIRTLKPKVIVEIGTDFAGFVLVAGRAMKENGCGNMWTVEVGETLFKDEQYRKVFCEVFDIDVESINFINSDSNSLLMFWGKPIDFLFIDGSKDEIVHQKDLFGYGEFVVPGGWIFVHDYSIKVVKDNVKEYAELNNLKVHSGGWSDDPKSWALMIKE